MGRERLAMRDVKKLFHLRYELGISVRQTAESLGVGKSTIFDYELRAKKSGLTSYEQIETLTTDQLMQKLFPTEESHSNLSDTGQTKKYIVDQRPIPNWAEFHHQLTKNKNLTRALLWEEYKKENPNGYQLTRFCTLYSEWKKTLSLSMRQDHIGGEKIFIDYAGAQVEVIDDQTGEVRLSSIFVGTLGASSYTYVEATWSQSLSDWLMSHQRMFEFFGGSSKILVPDNLKSGVTKPNRYEAKINDSYAELAEHYGCCVIPARVRKPKDKGKVEVAVQIVQRWIVAALRNTRFYSLEELNEQIQVLLKKLNNKKMKVFNKSRHELFLELDFKNLNPLPKNPYEFGVWKTATVNIDYHVSFDKNFYSVPNQHIKKQIEIRATNTTVEIYLNLERIASHRRSFLENRFVTNPEHRPKAHQAMSEWSPERMISWAGSKGFSVESFVKEMLSRKVHPEQSYRSILGVIRLADKYGATKLQTACEMALKVQSINYMTIKNILENKMDEQQIKQEKDQLNLFSDHENVRGQDYYH